MGSSRLPGKVLLPLGARSVLAEVLDRCAAIPGADLVVCAVPDEHSSDPVAAEAAACGAMVYRGPEADVLARYLGAARAAGAEVVMRITSDCPLIDPALCGQLLALRAAEGADYAANNLEPGLPHGLDCEAFTTTALAEAAAATDAPYDREHVTPWLRRAPHLRRASLPPPTRAHADERWTLDHPEDYAFIRGLFEAAGNRLGRSMAETLALCDRNPELRALNAKWRRDAEN